MTGRIDASLLHGDDLRRCTRAPEVPFSVATCGDGGIITLVRLLRVLPGKRIVGEANWQGKRVLAKLFVSASGHRHWERERRGVGALCTQTMPTPMVLFSGELQNGGYVLLTEFMPEACTLAERWDCLGTVPVDDPRAMELLHPAFALLGRLHAAGLLHSDLHLGNFLFDQGRLFLIDGDGISPLGRDAEKARQDALGNLALLIAQLPLAWESCLGLLLAAYCSEQENFRPDTALLSQAVEEARKRRLNHFLAKTVRDCSQFSVRKTMNRFTTVLRAEEENLSALLADPDQAIAIGHRFKDGGTCTVARVDAGGERRQLVVKRYNIKNFGHALSRFWRPSRAWRSWLAAHRLAFCGIDTPTPLAMWEERVGPLRRRAFLVTEFCPGENLLQHLSPDREPGKDEAAAILGFFQALFQLKISHGDMKATNLLWHAGKLFVIDLDAMTAHDSPSSFRRYWRRDRARFLKNWPENSPLYRWLAANLPEGE